MHETVTSILSLNGSDLGFNTWNLQVFMYIVHHHLQSSIEFITVINDVRPPCPSDVPLNVSWQC